MRIPVVENHGRRVIVDVDDGNTARTCIGQLVDAGAEYVWKVARQQRIVTAAEMDKMTPQERADAIDAGVIRSWDEVDDEFRMRLLARVPEVAARLPQDG